MTWRALLSSDIGSAGRTAIIRPIAIARPNAGYRRFAPTGTIRAAAAFESALFERAAPALSPCLTALLLMGADEDLCGTHPWVRTPLRSKLNHHSIPHSEKNLYRSTPQPFRTKDTHFLRGKQGPWEDGNLTLCFQDVYCPPHAFMVDFLIIFFF